MTLILRAAEEEEEEEAAVDGICDRRCRRYRFACPFEFYHFPEPCLVWNGLKHGDAWKKKREFEIELTVILNFIRI